MQNENLKKILQSASNEKSAIHEKMKWRQENKEAIKKSQEIVIQVLVIMREKKVTQKDLAELMQVAPQRVHTILRGDENLTMETVAKLEKALQTKIIDVVKTANNTFESVSVAKQAKVTQRTEYNPNENSGLRLAA